MFEPVEVKNVCDSSPCCGSVRESTDVEFAGFDCRAVRAGAMRLFHLGEQCGRQARLKTIPREVRKPRKNESHMVGGLF
jgi:hypothetical protein